MSSELPEELRGCPKELLPLLEAVRAAADPRRIRRGAQGFRRGAVRHHSWGPGWVLGRVRGGRGDQVASARLVRGELRSECDCVDTEAVCAHVPALLAAAAAASQPPASRPEQGPAEWRRFWSHGDLPPLPAAPAPRVDAVATHLARAPLGGDEPDLATRLAPLYERLRSERT